MVLMDFRPTEMFAAGHLPGAAHLDLFGLSLIDTDPAALDAFLWMIAHLLTSRGATDERTVVVYDEHSGIRAARAFWFLEFFDHPDTRVLDGGFDAWQRERFIVTRETQVHERGTWAVGRLNGRIATWRDVHATLGAADTVMLDTRSDGEYYEIGRAHV